MLGPTQTSLDTRGALCPLPGFQAARIAGSWTVACERAAGRWELDSSSSQLASESHEGWAVS